MLTAVTSANTASLRYAPQLLCASLSVMQNLASKPPVFGTANFSRSFSADQVFEQAKSAEPAAPPITVTNTDASGGIAPHPGLKKDIAGATSYMLMHPVYDADYLKSVQPRHVPPQKVHQKLGYYTVQAARRAFDLASGYGPNMDERKWLRRFIFLETVAGVPGMVGGMLRHMRSLRSMERDHGWIHTLLEEAENERMHLLTFLQLREPSWLLRGTVLLAQGVFFNFFLAAYLISPKTCHAFVGYLEEEAVKTYTRALEDLDAGKLPDWTNKPAPQIAMNYWKLESGSTMRELLMAVRADEACHMHVNHTFSGMKSDQANPFSTGSVHVP